MVLDLSAGLGSDGYLLYQLGCPVTLIERSKLVFILLKLNLSFANIPIVNMDSLEYLKKLDNIYYPDVIYFDPIFPEKNKTALSRKSARLLREVVGDDLDSSEVFKLALKKAKKRVVVKRPKHAKTITDLKPDVVFAGKAVRFDVYLTSA
ncbi:MAG: class I SAM-dependent methyltransferase [Gammaproteobacteria bacterium]|nr:class I SAM-dependent methyltransferase [Gammaproteobacteria bacterium]